MLTGSVASVAQGQYQREVGGRDAAQIVRPQDLVAQAEPIPLPPPKSSSKQGEPAAGADDKPMFTVISSLAIVLGLFCGFVWVSRKTGGAKGGALSSDLFTVLGTSQIDPRNQTALLKCGNRVLLVAITQGGITTLTEFTDPSEVNELVAAVNGKSNQAFANTLRELNDSAAAGDFGDRSSTKKRRGLFGPGVS